MTGVQLLAIVMIAVSGGAVAYGIWLMIEGYMPAAPTDETPAATPKPAAPSTPPPQTVSSVDSELAEQIAGLSRDIATLAQGQITLMEAQAERENRMLMEMRATAQASDPELVDSLKRIEVALGVEPPEEPAETEDATTDDEGETRDAIDDAVEKANVTRINPAPSVDMAAAKPDDAPPPRTIRRG